MAESTTNNTKNDFYKNMWGAFNKDQTQKSSQSNNSNDKPSNTSHKANTDKRQQQHVEKNQIHHPQNQTKKSNTGVNGGLEEEKSKASSNDFISFVSDIHTSIFSGKLSDRKITYMSENKMRNAIKIMSESRNGMQHYLEKAGNYFFNFSDKETTPAKFQKTFEKFEASYFDGFEKEQLSMLKQFFDRLMDKNSRKMLLLHLTE